MGRIIFVTSFKGGVGKTTVSAYISAALAAMGKNVLVVDGDYGNRCMDMVLGMENAALFDGADAIAGKTPAENAIISHDTVGKLYFLPAPAFFSGSLSPEDTCAFFARLKKDFDYVIVDSSAEDTPTYRAFARAAEDALVVSLHQSTAIRAAEKTGAMLADLGFTNIRLVINCFNAAAAERGQLPSVLDIIGRAKLQLIGVIPYDCNVPINQEKGLLPFVSQGKLLTYEAACINIAKRLTEKRVPLFKDVYKPKKLRKYL